MKKRILLASAFSLFIHWLLFGLNWSFLKERSVIIPKSRNVTITISYKKPEPAAEQPKKEKKKIRKSEIKPWKKTKKKEILKPVEAEKVAVEPVPFESEEAENLKKEIQDDMLPEIENTIDDLSEVLAAVPVIREASPLYRKNPPPVYPRVARRRGHQGTVFLEVLVARNGNVKDLRLLESSGYAALDDAALASVKGWIFEPGMKGNQSVEMWVKLPVRFQLE